MRVVLAIILAGSTTMAAAAMAQSLPDVDYQADRHEPLSTEGKAMGLLATGKPWAFTFNAPASWQSNLSSDHQGGVSGVSLDPELSVDRSWAVGTLTLSTTFAAFVSAPLPLPENDVSGWYATVELTGGDAASGITPYFTWQPVAVYAGVYGANLLTRHDLAAGLRRTIGNTSVDLSATRAPANVAGADRTALHLAITQRWVVGRSSLQVRGDLEQRWYDRIVAATDRREVTRARIRARAVVPLDPMVDLHLTAQWERHWSADKAWDFNNFTIGPTLIARFGF